MCKKILLIDDDPDIILITSIILKKEGFNVIGYNGSGDIFEKIKEEAPDLVILDAHIFQKDGYEICKAIKQTQEIQSIPVIIFTADHIEPEKLLEIKADDYVVKPFDRLDFIEKVKQLTA